jgi:phosphatidylglycerol:prolipoprotein diacylglycerol transferase
MFFRLKMLGISFLYFADLLANYLPIFQAISRCGCLLVGCCSGIATQNKSFFIIYKNAQAFAQINVALFPVQVVSIILSILIFIILSILRKKNLAPGKIFGAYLAFEGSARFFVDFWRHSRTTLLFETSPWAISSTQPIMILLIFFGLVLICK